MIKALFFDIDGTLVSFETHAIPASTIEAIAAARAKGIKIFIATGRPKAIINNLTALTDRGLIDGYVTMNGGYCTVGDEVIYKSAISPQSVQTMAVACRAKGFPCIFVAEHTVAVCQDDEQVEEIFRRFLRVDNLYEKSIEEATSQPIFQMTPFINAGEEAELMARMPDCESGRWYHAFTDITAKGNTKSKGIEEMIRYFGIGADETMAFGDGGNDVTMLRSAAVGVAMGNANDDVKQAADYVTASVDEDGIQKALMHLGII